MDVQGVWHTSRACGIDVERGLVAIDKQWGVTEESWRREVVVVFDSP